MYFDQDIRSLYQEFTVVVDFNCLDLNLSFEFDKRCTYILLKTSIQILNFSCLFILFRHIFKACFVVFFLNDFFY